MAIRMTGMYSNLDTDSIISELMKAQRSKIDKVGKQQTKLEWKVDSWKSLNTKIYSFYTGSLNDMKYTDFYGDKAATISNESIATVSASTSAADGTQELSVQKLAKSGYLTGGVIKASDPAATLSTSSKISELSGYSATGTGTIQVQVGTNEAKSIEISSSTTIGEVISKLKEAGVNANFDATNNRIFVYSTKSGADSNFNITATNGADGENVMSALGLSSSSGATKIEGQDAQITLNGATFTSSSNSFSVNGLNIVAKEVSSSSVDADGKTVYNTTSVTTAMDYDAIYKKVKTFFTEYNKLINEMDSLYNATSAKGYEPLTDTEKDAMTDTQVEQWEKKVKDALLRRDTTLGDVTTSLKNDMAQVFEINGEKYGLGSFGISTGAYFTTDSNQRGAYHIDGDKEDSTTSKNDDKLKSAIQSDPDAVVGFFTSLSKGVYNTLFNKMKMIEGVRSSFTVYEDKKMASDIDDYKVEIKTLEKKFKTMEDRYYSQFSAMETALAKLQSSSSSLTSLLGNS